MKMNRYKMAAIAVGVILTAANPISAAPAANNYLHREARLGTMITRATKEKDIILLNCLRSALFRLKDLHQIGSESLSFAIKAQEQENNDLEEHYLTKVKIVEAESLKIFAESYLCVGSILDKTVVRVVVSGPASTTPEDLSTVAGDTTRPPDASPLD